MPKFRPTGGIFWRLDASGNLTAYDTSGNVVAKFISQKFSGQHNRGIVVTNTQILSTTSLTNVYAGLSAQITPQISGTVLVIGFCISFQNGTIGDGWNFDIFRFTGTNNPAGGGAVSGGVDLGPSQGITAAANDVSSPVLVFLDSGLTNGTAYTYSVTIHAVTGGTASYTGLTLVAVEL